MNDVPNDPIARVAQRWAAPSQRADFTADINRAVAEWLRGVADGLDPPKVPDGVSVVSDDGADVADALDADGGVVVAAKESVR